MQKILVGCPVHNRGWVLPLYLDCIYNLDYPKEDITLCFIINDSHDDSYAILSDFKKKHYDEYNDIKLKVSNYNMPDDLRQYRVSRKTYYRLASVRNEFIRNITDEDYVLSIDSDILFPQNILNKLLSRNKDIVSALLYNDPSMRYPNVMVIDNGIFKHYFDFPDNSIFEIDITGAVYLLRAEVCKKVKYAFNKYGEDIPFCIDAKKLGYSLWCDSTIHCRHIMYPSMFTIEDKKRLIELKS